MGFQKFTRQALAPAFNEELKFNSTAAIIANRVVKLMNTGNVKHTTGTSGRIAVGVAMNGATGGGKLISVRYSGIVPIEASTKAIAIGDVLRCTSGAASTASRLGGTVRTTTVNNNIIGMALTSAAAGATKRLVSVMLGLIVNTVALS